MSHAGRPTPAMIYERRIGQEVFYILPVSSILGKLPVVPVGNTGTIPFSMRCSAEDFVGAAFGSAAPHGKVSKQKL